MPPLAQHSPRVLVIGLDGATYDVLVPLADQGVLPNIAALLRGSALGVLQSTRPYITPVAWTTFLTGCDPQHHGIFDYRYLDHPRRKVVLNQADRIATPTIFETVADSGRDVVSLNLPMTYPPPPGANTLIVGGLDSPSIEAALAPYPKFSARLRQCGAQFGLDPIWRRKPSSFEELDRNATATERDFAGRLAAARVADELTQWQLLVVQFQALDTFQHRCWHLLGIENGGHPQWVNRCRQVLRRLDDCVGELLALAKRRASAVIVVSDHGFGGFREKITLPELLARRGLITLPGLAARASFHAERNLWKFRRSLWRLARPGASTAQVSRPLGALLPIDWRRSAAVSLHGSLGGLIYLNSTQRFGTGPLTSAALLEQAAADTVAAFTEACHPDTGERLFCEAYSTAQRFQADPVERRWPDIVAIPAAGFHTRHKIDRSRRLMRPDPTLTGTHRADGVLVIDAPGVVVGQRFSAHLRDVAPTILHLLGMSPPAHMTGRVLAEMVGTRRPPSVRAPAPAVHSAGQQLRRDSDELLVEQRLRDLGYVE